MIGGVIAVHTVNYTTNAGGSVLAGGVIGLLHLNREVFFALTAFVLTYAYGRRTNWSLKKFWAKRYLYVGIPYLAWSFIFFIADGYEHLPAGRLVRHALDDIVSGAARYHLYFLLVTMQIYAVFPLLLWLIKATKRHPWVLLGVALAYQEVFTTLWHYKIWWPTALLWWRHHPDPWLFSYTFYVVAGGVVGMHLPEATAWVRSHRPLTKWLVAAGLVAGGASYCLDYFVFHLGVPAAGEVFQPVVAFTSCSAILGLFALGLAWADRGEQRRFRKQVAVASDTSFGVYLAHPLLIQLILEVDRPLIARTVSGRIPAGAVIPIDLLVIVPVMFAVLAVAVNILRRTPLSLPLTGRPQLRARNLARE